MRSVPVGRDLINNRNLCVCVFVWGGCAAARASLSPLLLRCSREGPIKGASASPTRHMAYAHAITYLLRPSLPPVAPNERKSR